MADNAFKKFWNLITGWTHDPANHYFYTHIPRDRTDTAYDEQALKPYRSYFRLWMCEMFLSDQRAWFTEWYPAVHSSVRLKFGDQSDVNFSHVAQAPKEAVSKGVLLNYRLTDLMPFNGGSVEIEAALLALKGKDYLDTTIKVLQGFSGLITAPLGQVLDIAEKVSSGMDLLLGNTDGKVHLALHQNFGSAGGGGGQDLRPGYIAVILADEAQIKKDLLWVRQDRLYYGTQGNEKPFQGFDYMLFRVEGREERDDWRLKNIDELLNKAMEAITAGETEKAEVYKKMVLATALTSPDLAVYDRRRVVGAIKEELEEIEGGGHGAVAAGERDLNTIVATRAVSISAAAAKGEMTFEELFGN